MSNDRKRNVVGQPVIRKDALSKALGTAEYTGDMEVRGMLYGKALRSRYPHARILSIDTGAARALPGVRAVLTARDIPGENAFGLAIKDQPVLAADKVRMMGDAVALVAADTEEIAEEALERIRVEYQELPGVFTIEDAIAEGAPLVHEDLKPPGVAQACLDLPSCAMLRKHEKETLPNVMQHTRLRKGDVEEGFALSAVVVENTYQTQRVDHGYIEPETSLALLDEEGVLHVLTSTQYPFRDRRQIAPVVAMPYNRVRVTQMVTGGAFGGKDDITTEIQASLLALATGRPVRVTWTRPESMVCSTKRHPMTIRVKTGADREGKLQALEGVVYSDKGAYCSIGHFITKKTGLHLSGPYHIPHIRVDTLAVYTNNTICGPYRGFGILQASFAHESQMDQLAEKLGLSPLDIRVRNALVPGLSNATGQVFDDSIGFRETLERAGRFCRENPWTQEGGQS